MKQTIISYLKEHLSIDGDFINQYKTLSMEEKNQLRQDAIREMEIVGIEIETPLQNVK